MSLVIPVNQRSPKNQGFIILGELLAVNPDFSRRDSKQAPVVTNDCHFSPSKVVQVGESGPGYAARRQLEQDLTTKRK